MHVRFVQSGDTTTVMVEHSGFAEDGIAEGYAEGLHEILGVFADFVAEEAS